MLVFSALFCTTRNRFVPFITIISIQKLDFLYHTSSKNKLFDKLHALFYYTWRIWRKQGLIFSCMYQKVLLCQVILNVIPSFPFLQAWLWPPHSNINNGPNWPNSNVCFYLYHKCLTLFFRAKNQGQSNLTCPLKQSSSFIYQAYLT